MGGHKMAKSAGNFQRVTELAERGLDPLAFRYLVLTSRYGRKLNYTDASVGAAAAALESLRAKLARWVRHRSSGPWAAPPASLRAAGRRSARQGIQDGPLGHGPATVRTESHAARRLRARRRRRRMPPTAPLSPAGRALHDRFVAALDDDLDLPTAWPSSARRCGPTCRPTSGAG